MCRNYVLRLAAGATEDTADAGQRSYMHFIADTQMKDDPEAVTAQVKHCMHLSSIEQGK